MSTQVVNQSSTEKYYGKITAGAIIAILCSSCFGMVSTSAAVPLLATFATIWPDQAHLIPQIVSLSSILMIPALFIVPVLVRKVSKKHIMMGATLLYFIGGFGPIISDSFYVYLAGRCLIGIAAGFMIAMPTSLVGQLFEGKKATRMLGSMNATASLLASVVSTAVGFIVMTNWRNTFWIFLFFLLLFVLQWVFIPKLPPEAKDETMPKVDEKGVPIKFPTRLKIGLAGFFVYFSFQVMFIYTMSIAMQNAQGTPAQAGFANTVTTVVAFTMSFLFIPLWNAIKRWTLTISLAFSCVMFLSLYMADSIGWVFLASASCGGSITMMYTYMWKRITLLAPRCWISTAFATFSICAYVGQFLAAYVVQAMGAIMGGPGTPTYLGYLVVGIAFLIVTIVNVSRKEKVQSEEVAA